MGFTLEGCTFENNQSGASGGAGFFLGNGMLNHSPNEILISNCEFTDNGSAGAGGGFRLSNHGFTILNSTFEDNTGSFGAGFLSQGTATSTDSVSVVIDGSTFDGNAAGVSGGGFYLQNQVATITNTTFNDNLAQFGGGYIYLGSDEEVGGGIATFSDLTFTNAEVERGRSNLTQYRG